MKDKVYSKFISFFLPSNPSPLSQCISLSHSLYITKGNMRSLFISPHFSQLSLKLRYLITNYTNGNTDNTKTTERI